jgi:hypothetical protein
MLISKINLKKTNWENISIGVKKYLLIMRLVGDSNVQKSKDFQKLFNGFYRVRQRSPEFYEALYKYLEQNKNKEVLFEDALTFFYKKFHRFEPSFSSKLVATINPKFPIWDSRVLARLNFTTPHVNLESKIRLKKMVEIYQDIVSWYYIFMKTPQAKEMINIFDKKIGHVNITNIKKIDFILWQTQP